MNNNINKKRVLFIDRDGTLIVEPPITEQVDSLEELEFLPGVIRNLYFLRQKTDYEMVIVTNQDGLGTEVYPRERFEIVQRKMLQTFHNEGIDFDGIYVDESYAEDNLPTRKPGTGLLTKYFSDDYDLKNSYVIGDRESDMELARNLGSKGLLVNGEMSWDKVTEIIYGGERIAEVKRRTKETEIEIILDLDGSGKTDIKTGLGFFDHMLEQIGRHSGIDLKIDVKGDLSVDEHHTIEDTAIALGECIWKALGDKRGIERYGYCLPMDDCLCSVALDFGGRSWLVYDVEFKREKVGDVPTEMWVHFFKSLSDSARMNLNIEARGGNEHHKIEGIFKALAKSLKMAIKRDIYKYELPTTKGVI